MSNEIKIHEGELLRKVLLSRFATLKEAAAELPENAPYRNRFLSTACELSEVSQKLDLIQ